MGYTSVPFNRVFPRSCSIFCFFLSLSASTAEAVQLAPGPFFHMDLLYYVHNSKSAASRQRFFQCMCNKSLSFYGRLDLQGKMDCCVSKTQLLQLIQCKKRLRTAIRSHFLNMMQDYPAIFSQNRIKMVATCARVALPCGFSVVPVTPVISSSAFAHCIAAVAYALISAASV